MTKELSRRSAPGSDLWSLTLEFQRDWTVRREDQSPESVPADGVGATGQFFRHGGFHDTLIPERDHFYCVKIQNQAVSPEFLTRLGGKKEDDL